MTEAQWLACKKPAPILEFLRGRTSDRKLRLFACGYGRRVLRRLPRPLLQRVVEAAEGFADGAVPFAELEAAGRAALREPHRTGEFEARQGVGGYDDMLGRNLVPSLTAAEARSEYALRGVTARAWLSATDETAELAALCGLLHDLVNPFHAGGQSPSPMAVNVADLARTIYDDRSFDRLPILADALMDAGCADEQLLAHLRSPGPHVRGCWALDLILGKN